MMTDPRQTEPPPNLPGLAASPNGETKGPGEDDNSSLGEPIVQRPGLAKRYWLWGLMGISAATLAGGGWYGQYCVQTQIAPLIAQGLGNFLNRPVTLGKLQAISWNSLRFGASQFGKTSLDPDQVSMVGLEIHVNPLEYLLRRQLHLEAIAIQPQVYLEQGVTGEWLRTPWDRPSPDLPFHLNRLRLQQANITLVARNGQGTLKPAVSIFLDRANLDLRQFQSHQKVNFDLQGQLAQTGSLAIAGSYQPQDQNFNLSIRGSQLTATAISHLLPLPLALTQGYLDANLDVQIRQQRLTGVQGLANLRDVTAQLAMVPQPLTAIRGPLRFQGTTVFLEQVMGQLGDRGKSSETPPIAQVQGSFNLAQGCNLTLKTQPLSLAQIPKIFQIPRPNLTLGGNITATLQVTGPLTDPKVIAQVKNSDRRPIQIDRLALKELEVNFTLQGTQVTIDQFQTHLLTGGKLQGRGQLWGKRQSGKMTFSRFQGTIQAEQLALKALAHRYGKVLPVGIQQLSGQANVAALWPSTNSLKSDRPISLPSLRFSDATFHLPWAGGEMRGQNLTYEQGHWQGNVTLENLQLAQLSLPLTLPFQRGQLQGDFQVKGFQDQLKTLQARGRASVVIHSSPSREAIRPNQTKILAMRRASLQANNISLQGEKWQAQLQATDLPLRSWFPQLRLSQAGRLTARLNLAGNLADKNFQEHLTATGQAQIQFPRGRVTAQGINLQQGQWQASLQADQIPLGALPLQPRQALAGAVTGKIQVRGTIQDPQTSLVGVGQAELRFAQGQVRARRVRFDANSFEATLVPHSLGLGQFSPHLNGHLNGQVKLQGHFQQWHPQLTQVAGKLNFSQGLANLTQPLMTVFDWQAGRLQLKKVQTTNLAAQGDLSVDLAALKDPPSLPQAIKQINLSVAAQGLSLTQILPPQFSSYGGQVNFRGNLRGTFAQPQLQGELALENLQLGDLNFDRRLTGQVNKNRQGLKLQLVGVGDRLSLSLDSQNQPTALMWQRQGLKIQGMREKQQLFVMAQQVPLSLLQSLVRLGSPFLAPGLEGLKEINPNSLSLGGNVSGDVTLDLARLSAKGKGQIDQPRLGHYGGDRLTGDFTYGRGIFTLNQGQLYRQDSQYGLRGRLNLAEKSAFRGEISLEQVQIQDLLTSLQIFRLEDLKRGLNLPLYAQAKDLYGSAGSHPTDSLVSIGNPQSTINEQLAQLKTVSKNLGEFKEQRARQSRLPDLESLRGNLTGKIGLQGTFGGEIALNFQVNGQDWHWGQFNIAAWQLQGDWQKGQLSLYPLRLQTGNSLMTLTGKVGGDSQEGELQLENVPLQPFATLLGLPDSLRLGGKLQATIALGGNRANPKATGKLMVEEATLNQSHLQSTTGQFDYHQGRFNFAIDTVLNQRTDPLTLKGSIPFVFPFATVLPESDRFEVGLRVNNDSLKILDLITNGELAWRSGEGTVRVDVFGRLDPQSQTIRELQVSGLAQINHAAIAAKILPKELLTDVNGTIALDLNHLQVQNLTGKFSGGNIGITGSLALFPSQIPSLISVQPLTISLNNLAIKLPDLYEGGVRGDLQLGGSILEPDIGGNLELFKGEVLMGDSVPQLNPGQGWQAKTELKDFKLSLGEDVRVQRPLLLDFLARGGLTLNGTISDLKPEGIISLKSGQVNLFASQLRLAGGGDNTAHFYAHRGLDPYLNLVLASAITETSRNLTSTNPLSSEVDVPFTANRDSLQTVRIQANIQGYASQLAQSIQLTSTPSRSRGEIITLLGGSFINNLGQGDTTLGLANLASSAVLGTVQGRIGESLGLSQFRIFSTPLIDEKERTQANQVGVAAEAGIDLTNDFSVSVQKIFNADRPPQWGASYRINENVRMRASSNFSDDSRGVIEYEQRF